MILDDLQKPLLALDHALLRKFFDLAQIDGSGGLISHASDERIAQMRKLYTERKERVHFSIDGLKLRSLVAANPATANKALERLTELYVAIVEFRAALGFYHAPVILAQNKLQSDAYRDLVRLCATAEEATILYIRDRCEVIRKAIIF